MPVQFRPPAPSPVIVGRLYAAPIKSTLDAAHQYAQAQVKAEAQDGRRGALYSVTPMTKVGNPARASRRLKRDVQRLAQRAPCGPRQIGFTPDIRVPNGAPSKGVKGRPNSTAPPCRPPFLSSQHAAEPLAKGMSEIARAASLGRANLSKALSPNDHPRFVSRQSPAGFGVNLTIAG